MGLKISWSEFCEQMRKIWCQVCNQGKQSEDGGREPDRENETCMQGCFRPYIDHALETEAMREKVNEDVG